MNAFGEVYRHYEGGRYVVVGVAETHEHNGDLDVVYIPLAHGKLVTQPLRRDTREQDAWSDIICWPDAKERARFVRENEYADGFFETLFDTASLR